jgi:hypothetical protein
MTIRLIPPLIALGISALLSILQARQLWNDLVRPNNGKAGDTIVAREPDR